VQELSLSRKKSLFQRPLFKIGIVIIVAAIFALTLLNPQQETADFIKLPAQLETLSVQNAQQIESLGELQKGALGALHPTDSLMAVSPFEKYPQVINYLTGEIIGTFDYGRCFAFSPDGNTLAIGGTSSQPEIKLWDASNHQELTTFVGHSDYLNSLTFSPDGKWLASTSMDNTVRVWNVSQQKLGFVLRGHTDWVIAIDFSADGMQLASGSTDGTIRIWDTTTWQTTTIMEVKDTSVWDLAYNHNGNRLAAAYDDNLIRLWSPQTGEIIGTLKGHTRTVWRLAFAHDRQLLASISSDNTLRLWDVATLKSLHEIAFHNILGLGDVNFSPDGALLMLNKNLSTIEFWGVPTNT
jgi:WD40 repeat protein